MLDESGSDAESASYTTIWADVFQPRNREREEEEESIDASLSKENMGRFRSVDGTDNDNALGRRALVNWAWGRMSMNSTDGVLTRPASSLCWTAWKLLECNVGLVVVVGWDDEGIATDGSRAVKEPKLDAMACANVSFCVSATAEASLAAEKKSMEDVVDDDEQAQKKKCVGAEKAAEGTSD
jgi:hypothetical protein